MGHFISGALAFSCYGRLVFVFLAINTAYADSVIATIPMNSPFGVAFDSANGDVYVTNHDAASVSVIDGSTNKVIATISVGKDPIGIAFDPANGYVYVANCEGASTSVSVIDGSTNKVIANISVGSQ